VNRHKVTETRRRLAWEQGTIIKDWGGRLPVALIYPNSYYIGMSNLGIHAIYALLNSYRNVVCERAFCEKVESTRPLPVLSLESQRPLADFAVLALSVTFELDYFNIVRLLKGAGIPLLAADRDERHPLVIAGGPCIIANPMPLAPFFDCLGIGEAEVILPAMLPVISQGIHGRRDELLKALSLLPGVSVPQCPGKTPVARQWVKDLDDFPVASTILTRDTELGDLYLIEIQRGCGWGCRFCLVNNAFSPPRFRSMDRLVAQAEQGLRHRRRLGLVGPAVSDHPRFEELLTTLEQMGAEIAVSSLRIKPLPAVALKEMARGGTRTIALAPEAGSQRLRRVIQKGITEEDILAAIYKVAEQGMPQLKLYFMIGLPTETDDDVQAIADLTLKCKAILDSRQPGSRITLSVAPFVPKASTPYQWLPMEQIPVLNHRLALLRNRLPPRGIGVKAESPAWSQVQAVLARGDTEIAKVLANMKEVSLSGWRSAVEKCHLDIDHYAHKRWDAERELPWSILDSGTQPEHLRLELEKALS